jgi:hypothetical protein
VEEQRRSHGETYPGGETGDRYAGEGELQDEAPAGQAAGNVAGQQGPGAPADHAGGERRPATGGGAGEGVSANDTDPARPGPVGDQDFDQLGAIDAHVAVESPTFTDTPPAGHEPRIAPADSAGGPAGAGG